MKRSRKDRALCLEVAVVLGGGVHPDGSPNEQTLLRGEAAARLGLLHPRMLMICSGDVRTGTSLHTTPSEAALLASLLWQRGINPGRVEIEEDSRDTIGNLILCALRLQSLGYAPGAGPAKLFVVTSPFHLRRALFTARRVFSPAWQITGYPSAPASDDTARASADDGGRGLYNKMLEGLAPGDYPALAKMLQEKGKPVYKSVPVLTRFARRAA